MKKFVLLSYSFFFIPYFLFSQNVGIGTSSPNASAMLDISSNNKGVLIPRLSKAQRNAIASPVKGLMVFIDDTDSVGFHFYDGGKWNWVQSNDVTDTIFWKRQGNAGTNPYINFIGTVDDQPLSLRQNNTWLGRLDNNKGNYYLGDSAGVKTTTGIWNIAIGDSAMFSNLTGSRNILLGNNVMPKATDLSGVIAIGDSAAYNEQSFAPGEVHSNIYIGHKAGRNVFTGYGNIMIGWAAGSRVTSPYGNVFIGDSAGASMTSAGSYSSVFVGDHAGARTIGEPNTFVGNYAGITNTSGSRNTYLGTQAGWQMLTGSQNTFIGELAGYNTLTGSNNMLIGYGTDLLRDNLQYAGAIGSGATVDTSFAMVLGSVSNNIRVGIGTTKPAYRFHVAGTRTNDGGWADGIVVENKGTTGEAAISFRNTTMPSIRQWSVGLNQNPNLAFSYGGSFAGSTTKMLIDTIGRVGIGTTTPLARLHVADSSVVFTGPSTLPGTATNPPVSGAGNRMMWYPDKSAFRAGSVGAVDWDKDSIGSYSIGLGLDAKAKGFGSVSLGTYNEALGTQSYAMGAASYARGNVSFAMGTFVEANGHQSTAMGFATNASGQYSTAFGSQNIAAGDISFATGEETNAISIDASTFGKYTAATRPYSMALGIANDTIQDDSYYRIFSIGNGNGVSSRSNAMTVLYGGEVGIGTSRPDYLLHISSSQSGDGSYVDGIMVENTAVGVGEAAISLRNNAITSGKKWTIGINQTNTPLAFFYGAGFSTGSSTKMCIDTSGNVGIGINSPAYKLDINGTARVSGDFSTTGDINMTTGEINRSSTSTANLVPICYGSITTPTTINSGTGNFTIAKTATGVYQITITSESYSNTGYTSVVSPVNSAAIIVTTNAAANKLQVNTFNAAGTATDTDFHFTVYKQ